MGYIYKITNKVNNKVYIGQTIRTLEERWQQHLAAAKRQENRRLYDSMNHHGYENFIIEPIIEASNEELNNLEMYYIAKYQSTDTLYGYNMTAGGGAIAGSLPPEVEAVRAAKISAALSGRKQPQELIQKRSDALRGKPRSLESRLKYSEAQKLRYLRNPISHRRGICLSDETKQKLREANLGKKQSDETKAKRKAAISQLKWWNNGTKNIRALECPDGFVAGRINFKLTEEGQKNSCHKGSRWFTNGLENCMAYSCPNGFWPGRTWFNKEAK